MSAPNYSAADFLGAKQSLMPRGPVWPRDPDATLTLTLKGLVVVTAGNNAAANALLVDAFPLTAVDLLPEWEATLGLPDPCLGSAPTLAQRQASVAARLLALGGASVAYFTQYALTLGFTVQIVQYAAFRCGFSRMGDRLGDTNWNFVWHVLVSGGALDLLKCEISRVLPAHTLALLDLFDSYANESLTFDNLSIHFDQT